MTDTQLAALTSQVRHYVDHFDAKCNNPSEDDWRQGYWSGKVDGLAVVLGWLESGIYESMVNLDEDTEARTRLESGVNG